MGVRKTWWWLAGNAGGMYVVGYRASKAFTQILAVGLWIELKPKRVDVRGAPSKGPIDSIHMPCATRPYVPNVALIG